MNSLADLLETIGSHAAMIGIAAVEVLVIIVIVAGVMSGKFQKKTRINKKDLRVELLNEMDRRNEEVTLLFDRHKMMPVCGVGNIPELLGVTISELQEDIACIRNVCKEPDLIQKIWRDYQEWDGKDSFKVQFELKNNQWVQMSIRRDDNNIYDQLVFYSITDVHNEREEYERKLMIAKEESQSKTTFLSRMSHEIRTPMNGVVGMLALARGKLSETSPAIVYLKKADELSDHLISLINDILDMSRIESGKVELENKPLSLRKLGDKLYDMFAKQLDAKGVHYEVKFEDITADYVIGDELRISQIIINFLSNAVKFTSEGEVTVTFREMFRKDGIVDVMICVHDTGIGMNSEFVNRIFRPFEQEGIETQKKYGGTGLGMAITDQLVHIMGGEIVVKSAPGKGSDFTVFLHLPETTKPVEILQTDFEGGLQSDENENTAFRGQRILLAEDNEINAMIAEEMLDNMGAEVEVAENGQEAVDYYRSQPDYYYDFILMDIQMPIMNGREAAKTIRQTENRMDSQTIPIFALSADAFVEDERLSLESGMDGHFAKPIDFQALQKGIGAFLNKRRHK